MAGKEFKLHTNGTTKTLTVSVRGSIAGGQHYTKINLDESRAQAQGVYYDERAYAWQRNPYSRFDLKLLYSKNKKHTTRQWELRIQNVTNSSVVTSEWYNAKRGSIVNNSQLGLLPVLSYRIEF